MKLLSIIAENDGMPGFYIDSSKDKKYEQGIGSKNIIYTVRQVGNKLKINDMVAYDDESVYEVELTDKEIEDLIMLSGRELYDSQD